MSGGDSAPDHTTQTTTITPNEYVAPYIQPFLQRAQQLTSQPYQPYTGQQVAPFSPTQQQAFDMIGGLVNSSNGRIAGAQDLLNNFATGGNDINVGQNPMLGMNNPYLQQAINATSQDVINNYQNAVAPGTDAAFARNGAFGGSAWQNGVAQNQHQLATDLGNVSSSMRMQDYTGQQQLQESNLNRLLQQGGLNNATQLQAIGAIPGMSQAGLTNAQALLGVGNQQQQQQQNVDSTNYQNWLNQQQFPYQQLATMQSAIGTGMGAGSTTIGTAQNPYQTNPLSGALGGAAGGLGLIGSLSQMGAISNPVTAPLAIGAGALGALGGGLGGK